MAALLLPVLLLAGCLAQASLAGQLPDANATVETADAVQGSGRFHYLALTGSDLIVVDTKAHALYQQDLTTGDTTLLAGGEGEPGYRDGPGPEARFNCPTAACALPGSGSFLVVADSQNACIRLVDRAGNVSTLAGACGERAGYRDGPAHEALFARGMRSLACLENCSVLVGDASNGRLRRIDVSGAGCPAPPGHPHRFSPLTVAAIWLLGGAAVLAAALLAVRRWAVDKAERVREVRAGHAVTAFEASIEQGLLLRPNEESEPQSPFARHQGPPLAFEPAGPSSGQQPPAGRKGPTPWSSLGYMDGTGLPVYAPPSGSRPPSRPPSRRPSLDAGRPPRPPARAASLHNASTSTEAFADLNPLPPSSV